mmetsp:Transcript_29583/g.58030  ORF Transcript_29583/g.58030 Transcript_29583/m.58030 type:complete len:101 (+) Transcript_29583:1-303(+)
MEEEQRGVEEERQKKPRGQKQEQTSGSKERFRGEEGRGKEQEGKKEREGNSMRKELERLLLRAEGSSSESAALWHDLSSTFALASSNAVNPHPTPLTDLS